MIGLPTITTSRISSRVDAGLGASVGDQLVERVADGAGHLARAALGMSIA